MSITRLQQARQMYAMGQRVAKTLDGSRPGYRGDDAYGSSSRSRQATDSRAATSSTNSSAPGGSSGQETRGDGPAPTTFQGNTQIVDTRSNNFMDAPLTKTTIDPLDIKEQYKIGNPINLPGSADQFLMAGPSVTFDQPYMTKGLETNRYTNYLDAQNLKNHVPNSINIPFMPLANKGLKFLQKFGNDKNTQFFADNVAGKYGYGYGVKDYQKYMRDRMSGKVGAYGNEEQGQNALNALRDNQGGGGIMDVYSDNTTGDTTDDTTDNTTTENELLLRFLARSNIIARNSSVFATPAAAGFNVLSSPKNLKSNSSSVVVSSVVSSVVLLYTSIIPPPPLCPMFSLP